MVIELKVEKGVPIPAPSHKRKFKYPFLDMAVGDSFFIPCQDKKEAQKYCGYVLCSARNYPGLVITTRSVEGGLRVWRVEKKGDKP